MTDTGSICVVGLGYVGLPLVVEFDREGFDVIGLDVDEVRIERLRSGIDPTDTVGDQAVGNCEVEFTPDEAMIEAADYVLVAVPTPLDKHEHPDLEFVTQAATQIGRNMQEGTIVVLESTVYPGATREVFVPRLERASGLTVGEEFGVGYSPERLVPGDPKHGIRDTVKLVSGWDGDVLEEVAKLYDTIVDEGIHRTPTIETAETAKVVENTQRDLNIALMNELAIACHHLDLASNEVLEAAGTKWNFHEYRPGLVGGHCIPVDPFFLVHESEERGFSPELVQKAREVNEYVPQHVADVTIHALNQNGKVLRESRVLVLGLSYKPNVEDIRTSAVTGVVSGLEEFDIDVVGFDPLANDDEARETFEIDVQERLTFEGFDAVVIGTPHGEFTDLDFGDVAEQMNRDPTFVDIDGQFTDEVPSDRFTYRRL